MMIPLQKLNSSFSVCTDPKAKISIYCYHDITGTDDVTVVVWCILNCILWKFESWSWSTIFGWIHLFLCFCNAWLSIPFIFIEALFLFICRLAARTVMAERKESGPIRPCHIREAHRRLKLEGKVPKRSVPRLFR